jgi:hypothetical protein
MDGHLQRQLGRVGTIDSKSLFQLMVVANRGCQAFLGAPVVFKVGPLLPVGPLLFVSKIWWKNGNCREPYVHHAVRVAHQVLIHKSAVLHNLALVERREHLLDLFQREEVEPSLQATCGTQLLWILLLPLDRPSVQDRCSRKPSGMLAGRSTGVLTNFGCVRCRIATLCSIKPLLKGRHKAKEKSHDDYPKKQPEHSQVVLRGQRFGHVECSLHQTYCYTLQQEAAILYASCATSPKHLYNTAKNLLLIWPNRCIVSLYQCQRQSIPS